MKLSHAKFHRINFNKAKTILKENNYPNYLINRIFFSTPQLANNIQSTNTRFYKFPNVGVVDKKMRTVFKKHDINLSVYNIKTNNKLIYTRLKDKIETPKKSNIVYKISCTDCPSTYIGNTSQYCQVRAGQHANDVRGGSEKTALAKHAKEHQHKFDFKNVKILDSEECQIKREIMEVLRIQMDKNSCNFRTDTATLNNMYKILLDN